MSDDMHSNNTVVALNQQDPQGALERLNRLTGLSFHSLPESLVNGAVHDIEQASNEKGEVSPPRPLFG